MKKECIAALCVLVCSAPAAAQDVAAAPHVVATLGATSDAWDAAALGGRTLVATSGGLVVLDASGHEERTLGTADGLPGARVRSVTSLDDGGAWVGTIEGAVRLDAALHVAQLAPVRRVSRAATFAGRTWLGSFGDGLFRLDAAGPVHVALGASGARDRVSDLRVVGGELWVATAGAGIVRVGADGAVVGRITSVHGLPDDVVLGLGDGGDGHVLVATMDGPASVLAGRVETRARDVAALAAALPVRDVRALARAPDGTLVAATWGAGLWRVSHGVASRVPGAGDHARRVVVLPSGVVTLGEDGAARLAARGASPLVAGGLPSGDVTCLARAFGSLWAGTFTHGLARLAADAAHAEAQPRVTGRFGVDGRVNDLAVTRDGRGETLWIATDRGLFASDGRSYWPVESPEAPPRGHVLALLVDGHGDLWASSSHEVARLSRGAWRSYHGTSRVPLVSVSALAVDARGRVWLGTLHGLVALDPATGALTARTVASGALPVDWVTALVARGDGVVAGTYHGGLVEVRGDGTTRTLREGERGLGSGWVNAHALALVRGALWVGTLDRGLYVGDLDHGFVARTTRDGLPSDDVTSFRAEPDGSVLATTRAGVVRLRD